MAKFAIHVNSGGATFVKDYDFFVSQGGLKQPWGKAWKVVEADSLAKARAVAIAEPDAFSGLYCARCGCEDIRCLCAEGVLRKGGRW